MSKMNTCKRFLTALMAMVLLCSACAPAALASFKAKINTNTKVYSVPSTSAKRSVKVPKGLTVTVTATSGNWARVKYKGNTAYMPITYLNLVNRLTAYTAKSTPVYKKASSSSSKMGTLSIGTAVYVVGKSGGYYRVQNSSGSVTGYVKTGNLTTKAKLTAAYNAYKKAQAAKSGSSSSGGGSAVSKLQAYCKALYGKPYSASASLSSAPGKFNCSTFVNYVMKHFGISMKSTAAEQANDGRYKKITNRSDLQAGDILCFDTNGNGVCDHTAIYLGNGKFAEASRNAGKVHENSFSSYYKEHFMWARRPV